MLSPFIEKSMGACTHSIKDIGANTFKNKVFSSMSNLKYWYYKKTQKYNENGL